MTDAHGAVTFTDEERAHLESFGRSGLGEATPPVADTQREEQQDLEPEAHAPGPQGEDAADAAGDDPDVDEGDDAEGEGEQGDGRKKPRRVAYRQFVKERKAAEEARKAAEEMRQKLELAQRDQAVLTERMRLFSEQQQRAQMEAMQRAQAAQQPPQQPSAPPDMNEDPMGFMRWQSEQLQAQAERLAHIEGGFRQTVEQQRQAQQISQLDNAYRSDNMKAAQQHAEYPKAYNYLLEMAKDDLRLQNRNLTEDQIEAQVRQQERMLAATAFQQNMRPAEMIWQMAHRRGFRTQGAQVPQGQPAAQAQPQMDPAAEQARLDAVARGQQQNRSLSTAGRPGGGTTAMTIEKFGRMSDTEAVAWMEANPEAFARLAGEQR